MEISNTYLVRIWYILTLVRTKNVFASLNTPFGTYLVRICFSKYVLHILTAYHTGRANVKQSCARATARPRNCLTSRSSLLSRMATRTSSGLRGAVRLRCRGCEDHFDEVRARTSKASKMSAMPKGAGWKTSVEPRVLIMPVESRVFMMTGNAGPHHD